MKKIFFSVLLFLILGTTGVFSYDLTDQDEGILDRTNTQLIKLIDTNEVVTAEIVVDYIYTIIDTRDLSDRQEILLEIIADDIEWEYEIGYYAESFEAMTADMCYEDEYYDPEDEMCYFDEENYSDDEDESDYEIGDISAEHDLADEESEVLAAYNIDQDRIELISGTDAVRNQEIWNIFTTLIPLPERVHLGRYEVVDDAESDTAAHVVQMDADPNMWILSVNLDSFYIDGIFEPEESYATLIHEFAHILTFNKDQVRYYPVSENEAILERFAENCQTNLVDEGCLTEEAYLDDFIDIFWSDVEYLEQVRNEEISAYDDTPESFVTDYAATNPGEDIAESFTYFVMRTKATGASIADQKLNFFYAYPELVTLRKQIRSRLESLK